MRQIELDDVLGRIGNPHHRNPLIARGPRSAPARIIDLREEGRERVVTDPPAARVEEIVGPAADDIVKVLLIEDSRGDARLVREMLRDALDSRFELVHVERASVARAALERHPDLACVLLDLSLPDAHGLSALTDLKRAAPNLPIVVLTGSDRLELAVESLQGGAQDYLVKGRVDGDLLARSLRYAIERKRLETELEHQALHDPLTSLPNRRLFLDRVASALARLRRHPGLLAVLFVDLDRLKSINDDLGHEAGDRVLTEVAGILEQTLRPNDTVARFGGDEFTILCEDVGDEAEAHAIAERLAANLRHSIEVESKTIDITASIGVVVSSGKNTTPEALTRNADIAMYEAKARGKARSVVFDRGLGERASDRAALEVDLDSALGRDQFELFYQPLVTLTNERVVGVEGLLRWGHPVRGYVEPQVFVEVAEASGAIVALGAWTLGEVTRQIARWHAQHLATSTTVSVNISPRQLADPHLADHVRDALATSGIDPALLCLEITETAVITDLEGAARVLGDLKDLGVRLAIDDFGTGYGSLTYARRLPVDVLKIDRSFVCGIARSPDDLAIVSAVVSLAHTLGLSVVAEGVEKREQLNKLADLGCDVAQGHLFAPAMPPAELTGLLLVEGTNGAEDPDDAKGRVADVLA